MSKSAQTTSNQSLRLYRLVFHTRITRVFVLFVMGWLLVQPALVVYANDTTDAAAASEPEIGTEAASEVPTETETEIVTETIPETTQEEIVTDEATSVLPESDDTEAAAAAASSTTDAATSTTSADTLGDSTAATNTVATSSNGVATTSDQSIDTDAPTVATTTVPVVPEQSTVTTNDSYYQFSRDDCVRVQDGSFYCGTAQSAQPVADSFYVALDADGDRELFVVSDGVTQQITHNTRDDAAPYYDSQSDTLVWHTLIAGRYQIMSYDFTSAEETQLTTGRTNNMEPTRYGTYTVWQQWGENGWEIMLHDGETVTQLTENSVADIAPAVNGTYVIWKRVFSDEQVAVMYDIQTGKETTIVDTEDGTAFKNARLMLVYEGVTAAGDHVIRGVDPTSGMVVPIQSLPNQLPENIPTSEPTQEVRALVHPKLDVEQEDLGTTNSPIPTGATTTGDLAASSTATSSTALTLVLPTDNTVKPLATTTPEAAAITTDFDIVIPPNATSTEG